VSFRAEDWLIEAIDTEARFVASACRARRQAKPLNEEALESCECFFTPPCAAGNVKKRECEAEALPGVTDGA
jgi:hypothetical protein